MAGHVGGEPNWVTALSEINHRFEFLSVRAARDRLDQHYMAWRLRFVCCCRRRQRQQHNKGQSDLRGQFGFPSNVGRYRRYALNTNERAPQRFTRVTRRAPDWTEGEGSAWARLLEDPEDKDARTTLAGADYGATQLPGDDWNHCATIDSNLLKDCRDHR
jgi:hypothetical protein